MKQDLSVQLDSTEIISEQLKIHLIEVAVDEQIEISNTVKKREGVLLTEWVAEAYWYVLYLLPEVPDLPYKAELLCIRSALDTKKPLLVDLTAAFPVTNRLQRAIYELTRISTRGAKDQRLWLNHGHWPIGILNKAASKKATQHLPYSFHKVSGEGVHEIAVGPIHAGIIEPGHFRFSVVGERILKLEERFGYVHKGIHALLCNQSIEQAARLISRVSGDSTVGYAWAFAMACENAARYRISAAESLSRAILLERERLANHIGDSGAIINDTGLPSLQSQFTLLKEQILRRNQVYYGHRYAMDIIIPFQEQHELTSAQLATMEGELNNLCSQLTVLQKICEKHNGLQDRLVNTGILTNKIAKQLGVVGLVAKASNIDFDLRRLCPHAPYHTFTFNQLNELNGDVAARVMVRFKESFDSIELIKKLIHQLLQASLPSIQNNKSIFFEEKTMGFGCVESWRGPIIVIVSIANQKIQWCHFHDPSWQNWPALEYAVLNNIVADFPLINKSFNLSYSGHDG